MGEAPAEFFSSRSSGVSPGSGKLGVLTPQVRVGIVATAVTLFAVGTAIAWNQQPWRDPFDAPTGWNWFLFPRRAPASLTKIGAHLRGVWAFPNNRDIWAAGDFRTLVHSHDGGATWEPVPLPSPRMLPNPSPNISASKPPVTKARPSGTAGQPARKTPPANSASPAGKDPYDSPVQQQAPGKGASKASLWFSLPVVHAANPSIGREKEVIASLARQGIACSDIEFYDATNGDLVCGSADEVLTTSDAGANWRYSGTPRRLSCLNTLELASSRNGYLLRCLLGDISVEVPRRDGVTLTARALLNRTHAWLADTNGHLYRTTDGSRWDDIRLPSATRLNALFFQADGQRGWAAGSSGKILRTYDGGTTWTATTSTPSYRPPYSSGPAPWYTMIVIACSLLLAIVLLPYKATEVEPAIEVIAASDRPLEDENDLDPLSFRPIARGLAYFIRNRRTTAPLSFAITGPWGTGKTSLMRLLQSELRKHGFRPVWFNAWHHQKEKYLLPALLETIRREAVPKLWHRGGIAFRFRLLRSRWQWWFGILALLFVGTFVYRAATLAAGNVKPAGDSFDLLKFLKDFGPNGAALVSGLAILATLRRWLSAFGVQPASLLAGSGAKAADLERQTSFRYRFAKEFQQVTAALGPRQMVIFIDDLDRCQPENTLDALEGVNFLVSSGECFVVLGMAKELVEDYIARSLKKVAKALSAATPGEERTPRELAGEYLQKLINIEVPVPRAGSEQMRVLLDSLQSREKRSSDRAVTRVVGWICAALVSTLPVAAAIVLFIAGNRAGESFFRWLKVPPPPASVHFQGGAGRSAAPSAPTASAAARPAAQTSPAEDNEGPESPEFTAPTSDVPWTSNRPAVVILPLMGWVLYRIFTHRADLEPDDSDEFTTALDDVLPLVLTRAKTPRAIKRFVNKVRYLAMRRRQVESDDRTWWARFSEKAPAVRQTTTENIPDDALVVLAALDYVNPEKLESPHTLSFAIKQWETLSHYDVSRLEAHRAAYRKLAGVTDAN